MNLFVNETHIFLTSQQEDIQSNGFDLIWDGSKESDLPKDQMKGKVWLKYPSEQDIKQLLSQIIDQELENLTHLMILVKELKKTKKALTKDFKVIKAAGGLVTKEDKVLMIYRFKKWDLPKGKVEDGEKRKAAAVREVEEECNIKVELLHKLCTTWHYYSLRNKKILKQTKWYAMKCLEDSRMSPQLEEDIVDIKWMDAAELEEALRDTYNTIQFIVEEFQK